MMNKKVLSFLLIAVCFASFLKITADEPDDIDTTPDQIPSATIELNASPATVVWGEEITLTANVAAEGEDIEGSIGFYKGEAELITSSQYQQNGNYTAAYTPQAPGEYVFYAVFSYGEDLAVQSENVVYNVEKADNQVVLTTSSDSVSVNENVTFTAQVENITGGTVTFYKGTEAIQTAAVDEDLKTAQITVNNLADGVHMIKAVYSGGELYKDGVSNEITQRILSDNNFLKALKISRIPISFSSKKFNYSLTADGDVESIRITPTASHKEAVIKISVNSFEQTVQSGEQSGYINLTEGRTSNVYIIVTAENGNKQEYSLSIYRKRNTSQSKQRGRTITYRFDTQAKATVFADLTYHWAADSIYNLAREGVILGEESSGIYYFHPERAVTRTEFAAFISRFMHLDTTLTRFLPLPYGDEGEIPLWGLEHVRAVYKKGWMEGEGALFNPERSITRAEALTVISRMTGYSGGELYFNDSNDVPWWAASSIAGLVNAGIINGYEDNTIRPNDLLTRAEAAAILDKIM